MFASISAVSGGSDSIEIEQLPDGWETAWVTYKTSGGEQRRSIQIIDLKAKPPMQYFHDAMRTISIKCALLVLAIPFFATVNMTFHAVRTLILVLGTLARTVQHVFQAKNWGDVSERFVDWTRDTSEIILRGSWDFVKLPFLAVKMQLCCVYGIFFPLEGRVLAGNAERAIRGADRSHDLRRFDDATPALIELFMNKDSQHCFYWALCFQPIGPAVIQGNVLQVETLKPGRVAY